MEYQKSKRSNKKLYKRSDKRTKKRLNRRSDKRTKKKYKRVGGAVAADTVPATATAATAAATAATAAATANSAATAAASSDEPIYIIRHGLSCANAKKYESKTNLLVFHRILDPPLTKSSIEKSTGYKGSDLHGKIKEIIHVDESLEPQKNFVLCCSTLLRTQETCYNMFKRYLDHKNCLNNSIHILPYCNENFNPVKAFNLDNKPDPNIWESGSEDQKITKIKERVLKNYENLFKTKEPRKMFEVISDSIKLVDKKIFNLEYIPPDLKVSESVPNRENFKGILKKIKGNHLTKNPIIIVVTHSHFMKGELNIPEKPKNNSIYSMDLRGNSWSPPGETVPDYIQEFYYKGNIFDGFDNSLENLSEQVKICEKDQ